MAKKQPNQWDGVDELYRAVVPDLKRMAFLITGNAEFAEDAVHDAFLKVVPKVPTLEDHETVKRYLHRAVVNETKKGFRTLKRRQKRHELYSDSHPQVHYDHDSTTRAALVAVLRELKPKHRTVVVLTYVYDFDDQTIAHIMSCAVGTVKSTRARALASIRKVYQDNEQHITEADHRPTITESQLLTERPSPWTRQTSPKAAS